MGARRAEIVSEQLTPPDFERCQAEWRSGSFMTLGPRQMERCPNKPEWIATEKRRGKDGKRGSMSLCDHCRKIFVEKHPRTASFQRVEEVRAVEIVCFGCGRSTPLVTQRNIAGEPVHSIDKCMKRALSKRTREIHRMSKR